MLVTRERDNECEGREVDTIQCQRLLNLSVCASVRWHFCAICLQGSVHGEGMFECVQSQRELIGSRLHFTMAANESLHVASLNSSYSYLHLPATVVTPAALNLQVRPIGRGKLKVGLR